MNRNLHSPTKLTEFARQFDEEPDTIFSKFVNKLTTAYNSNYNNVNIPPSSLQPPQQQQQQSINTAGSSNSNSHSSSNSITTPTEDDSNSSNSPSINNTSREQSVDVTASLNDYPVVSGMSGTNNNNHHHLSAASSTSTLFTTPSTTSQSTTEDRTQLSVMQRISNLIAMRSNVCFI